MIGQIKKRLLSDKNISKVFKIAINRKIKDIGHITVFDIDSKSERVKIVLMLEEESELLDISVNNYILEENEKGVFLIVKELSASKKWLSNFVKRFICGKKIELPPKIATALKLAGYVYKKDTDELNAKSIQKAGSRNFILSEK